MNFPVVKQVLSWIAMGGLFASLLVAAPVKPGVKAEAPPIPGTVVARGDAGFLSLMIEGGNFVMRFYDAQRLPVAPDVGSAVLRWSVRYQPNDERTLLTPNADNTALTSEKTIRPPHTFKLFVSLLAPEGAAPIDEHYVVDFRD
ncbi:hypothetical protein K0B96_13355 [Horticoccus luteus]|uniref:Uncharacterized protein n=1 Tax=Horticoccus luteus TaxID=2862869 RepID=A0A8F9XKK1_9BACT|nr:hypothetical protein [Horticoccus luteus]QYM78281.1 hypothetical protein K0B96_13355 [Horticoccus luteus]